MNNAAKPSATKCKEYSFHVISRSGVVISGAVGFVKPVNAEEATRLVMARAAGTAFIEDLDFDPFNVLIDIRPIGKIYRTI